MILYVTSRYFNDKKKICDYIIMSRHNGHGLYLILPVSEEFDFSKEYKVLYICFFMENWCECQGISLWL